MTPPKSDYPAPKIKRTEPPRWLRQGSAALVGAIAVTMIAGSNAAHCRESPLQIIRDIHAIVAMTKGSDAISSKAVMIGYGSPDIQIKSLIVTQGLGADSNIISTLSHFTMRRDDITGASNEPRIWGANVPIPARTKLMFDEPFNLCCGQIPRITNFDMRDRYISISKHVDASRLNAQISALQNPCVFDLATCNYRQDNRERSNYERGDGRNFVMKRIDEGAVEPYYITPDANRHATALIVTAGIFVVFIVLACWWFL
jgi:hypothetical protein